MGKLHFLFFLPALAFCCFGQRQPRIFDAHINHNGSDDFLLKTVARLEAADAAAFLVTAPQELPSVLKFMKIHPGRLFGMGRVDLDSPDAIQMIDKYHAAGFRALGEIIRPKYNFDDRRYWPIYEHAEKLGMIALFHTGIVNRLTPEIPSDVSSDRMRASTLDLIARRFPKLTIIGAHLGNPDFAWAAEISRWNQNLYFDLSGSTLIKKQADYTFFKSIFWWTDIVSPHTPASEISAFEKIVFGSDVLGGDIDEFDREAERYHKMLDACGVSEAAQNNIFSGTLWRILRQKLP